MQEVESMKYISINATKTFGCGMIRPDRSEGQDWGIKVLEVKIEGILSH